MPQLIQRAPLGLLSLLDSKAGGQAPNTLSDLVTPTVELGPLYGIGTRERRTLSLLAASVVVGFNLVGSGNGLVPPGETWHLLNLTGIPNNVVAAGMGFAVGFADAGNRFSMVGSYIEAATATRPVCGGECNIWLPPGTQLGAWVGRTAAGGDLVVTPHFERYTL